MIPVERLFEAHITVRDFERSIAFYRDVVGLSWGLRNPNALRPFFGSAGAANP